MPKRTRQYIGIPAALAACETVVITWGSEPVEPVEAIMQTAGLRG